MKKWNRKLGKLLALAIAAGCMAWAASGAIRLPSPPPDTGLPPVQATNPAVRVEPLAEVIVPLRLTLDLRDGSRVVGTPTGTNVSVWSAIGNLSVEWRRLLALDLAEDKETAVLTFSNGDKLSGVLNLEKLSLTTSFGPAQIPLGVIRRLAVSGGGKTQGGLLLHFNFDKEDGEIVRDQSGQGHDGKFSGARWTSLGRTGGGAMIAGGVAEITVEKMEDVRLEDFTVALWVQRSNPQTTSGGGYQASLVGVRGVQPWLGAESDGRLYVTGVNNNRQTFAGRLDDLQWHHVAMVRRGKISTLYQDGKPLGEVEMEPVADLRLGLSIGSIGNRVGYPFVGNIDDVMIFNRPLPEAEIKALAQPAP